MPTARNVCIEGAVRAGVGFLLKDQLSDGCWVEWNLPPGSSGPWTTAYIGRQLAAVTKELRTSTHLARRAAALWLLEHQSEGGGWGYNDDVGCDADSTAHAILFLSGEGVPIPTSAYDRLWGFQQADGGFSTFPADAGFGSWGISHPDVSAVVMLALLTSCRSGEERLARAVRYVFDQRDSAGLWNSFWWCSQLYATRACLALVRAIEARVDLGTTGQALAGMSAGNFFERALLLESLLDAGEDPQSDEVASHVERLIVDQLPDGSWMSGPILRITNRDCSAPWECANAGSVYADPARLFTSATVLRALCHWWCMR